MNMVWKNDMSDLAKAAGSLHETDCADATIAMCLAAAAAGDISAYFDLGVICSTGSNGLAYDLVEAHKWFNLAAAQGQEEAGWARSDIAEEMTAREIAEAQRRARAWLASLDRNVA